MGYKDGIINVCKYCGDMGGGEGKKADGISGHVCPSCKTEAQRKEMRRVNLELESEDGTKRHE